jgi:hypothetical protein
VADGFAAAIRHPKRKAGFQPNAEANGGCGASRGHGEATKNAGDPFEGSPDRRPQDRTVIVRRGEIFA